MCLTSELLCLLIAAATYTTEKIDLTAFFVTVSLQLSPTFAGVMLWFGSLLLCGFGTFPKHALFIPSVRQFSFDATQFLILESGSCLLFQFTLIGQGSDSHCSVLQVGEALGKTQVLTIVVCDLGHFLRDENVGLDLIMKSFLCVLSLFMPHLPLSICVNESL